MGPVSKLDCSKLQRTASSPEAASPQSTHGVYLIQCVATARAVVQERQAQVAMSTTSDLLAALGLHRGLVGSRGGRLESSERNIVIVAMNEKKMDLDDGAHSSRRALQFSNPQVK